MSASITIDGNGAIAVEDAPLVAGALVCWVHVAHDFGQADMRLVVSARFSGEILAVADGFTVAQGQWAANLNLATRAIAAFMLTARADERRDVALELVSGNTKSLARETVPLRNSALVREAFPDLYPRPL